MKKWAGKSAKHRKKKGTGKGKEKGKGENKRENEKEKEKETERKKEWERDRTKGRERKRKEKDEERGKNETKIGKKGQRKGKEGTQFILQILCNSLIQKPPPAIQNTKPYANTLDTKHTQLIC